jgi:hypothetical protein
MVGGCLLGMALLGVLIVVGLAVWLGGGEAKSPRRKG